MLYNFVYRFKMPRQLIQSDMTSGTLHLGTAPDDIIYQIHYI